MHRKNKLRHKDIIVTGCVGLHAICKENQRAGRGGVTSHSLDNIMEEHRMRKEEVTG